MLFGIITLLGITNVITALFLYRSRKSKKPAYTIDARKILHDLTRGNAVVKIIPIASEDMFLWSPKDSR